MLKRVLVLCLCLVAVACGDAEESDFEAPNNGFVGPDGVETMPDAGQEDANEEDAVEAPDVVEEEIMEPPPELPKPEFVVLTSFGGELAVTSTGLRDTFVFDGQERTSSVEVSLKAEGFEICVVVVRPTFAEFGYGSPRNRAFGTVLVNLGGGEILTDECGWDQQHVLTELSALGLAEFGFAEARFEEDRPGLDVYTEVTWPVEGFANRVDAGRGQAFFIDPNSGQVNTSSSIQPVPGTLFPGLYTW